MPAASVSFNTCKFKELGNLSLVPNLKKLILIGCRNLEKFKGDNSNINWMIVEDSRKLDLRTLKTFSGIESLTVNNCTQPMNLLEISGLEHVRSLNFMLCNVEVGLINLKEHFPSLEKLYVSGMIKEFGKQLKQLNPDVKIGSWSFEL